jgi:hypothetical protein
MWLPFLLNNGIYVCYDDKEKYIEKEIDENG